MSQDDERHNSGGGSSRNGAPPPPPRGDAPAQHHGGPHAVLLASLADRYGVPAIDVEQLGFPTSNLELIPFEIARRQCVLPVLVREDAIFLAMADPGDRRVIDELEFVSAKRVFPYVALRGQLAEAIEQAYRVRDAGEMVYRGPREGGGAAAGVEAAADDAPGARGRIAPAPGSTVMAEPAASGGDSGEFSLSLPSAFPPNVSASIPPLATNGTARASGAPQATAAGGPTLDSVFTPLGNVRGKTVLVVDDEQDIRVLLRRVLEARGYAVLEADRGSVALAMVKQHTPDAIVLDAMLPELHGFDICRRIKSSARYGHIPILMISAVYRGWRYAEDLKSAYGVNAYIEKPFRIAEVLAALEELLAGAPRADERDPEALTAEAESALTAGMAAYKAGDVEGAIAEIERGLRVDPLSYRLHYHLALLLGRKGDVFRAIQELETATDLNPRSFPALKNLAVLYQRAGFKNKAIEMWERAIGQSPDEATRGQIKDHLMSLL